MTWTKDYRLHSVRFHPDGGNELIISGITNGSIQPNAEVLREVTSGAIYAESAVLQTLRLVGSFTTFQLEQVWGADGPGVNGGDNSCIHGATNPGLDMVFVRQGCAGADSAANDHLIYNIAEGVIVPNNLTVDHRGNAEMTYDIFASSTGSGVSPVTKADLPYANLPTLVDNSKRWTINEMWVNSIAMEGKRNISINFNANITQEGADSDTFDSVTSLDSMLQRAVITGVDPDWLDTTAGAQADEITGIFGETILAGTAGAPGTCYMYLKERNSATTLTEHIFLGLNGLLNWETVITGDPRSPSQAALAIDVTDTGVAGSPIVATPGIAIPP
jgi:hypothetical protein